MTYLDNIIAFHRQRAASDGRSIDELRERVDSTPRRGFVRALLQGNHLSVIAEIKRRSPSKGDIDSNLDPAALASDYLAGGAACLSVLTDEPHFGGSTNDLATARAAVQLPVLRKDFTVCANDVLDARLMGADALLLIAAALNDVELKKLHALAEEIGLDVLVEVHDLDELDRALNIGAKLVGVNQRDLHTFEVDMHRAAQLGERIPSSVVAVAESGITGADDAQRCAQAGYRAILVGEHLVRSANRAMALKQLQVALPS